jgi:IclR family acetate operon transcriptional repressor
MLGSVRNAARVLRAFSGADTELGVTDLARRLGLGKSTVHRIVTTLTAERLLERGRTRGTYRIGLALCALGTPVSEHVDLHQAALPVLAALRHATGETVVVSVLDGLEVVYVERLEGHSRLPIFRPVGYRLPASRTSSGKVLLAALAPDELDRRLADWHPTEVTSRTILTRDRLLAELARVVGRGFAVNDEEGHPGVVSVAAPIRGWDGEVIAAMSVVGEAGRMRGQVLRHHTALLLESAAAVSSRLGHRPVRSRSAAST